MFVPLPVLVAAGVVFLLLVARVVRPGRRDPLMGGQTPVHRRTTPAVATLPPETAAEVRALLAAGRKIDAIKLARDVTHLGLRETKELVESMAG